VGSSQNFKILRTGYISQPIMKYGLFLDDDQPKNSVAVSYAIRLLTYVTGTWVTGLFEHKSIACEDFAAIWLADIMR
jgi:hypothetical protein